MQHLCCFRCYSYLTLLMTCNTVHAGFTICLLNYIVVIAHGYCIVSHVTPLHLHLDAVGLFPELHLLRLNLQH